MKGIILAGGLGTRLRPLTNHVNKCLLPVGDKPLAQYCIASMRDAGIEDVCIVTRPEHATQFAQTFGHGSAWEIDLTLRFQSRPRGIADAITAARRWAGDGNVMVLLGDSIFGHQFKSDVADMDQGGDYGAVIYSAIEIDPDWCAQIEWDYYHEEVIDIHEKPEQFVSNDVVPGCYLYGPDVWDRIDRLEPSGRGELEITDLNRSYLRDRRLKVRRYEGLWVDAGTDLEAYIKAQSRVR